ncbi:MAG: BamA/TamA family outer membrane protein [Calditrichaeota bacterium]|nr:BamA/TamA family outer membrane protein [Calditrichota bacterium]
MRLRLRTDWRLSRYWLMWALAIAALTPLWGQKPAPGQFFLKELDIRFSERFSFPKSEFKRQYENRPYLPGLRREIGEAVLERIRGEGYYFARLSDSEIKVDSLLRQVHLKLEVSPGPATEVARISLSGADSLRESLRNRLSNIGENYGGRAYTPALASQVFGEMLTALENEGYPLARLNTGQFSLADPEPDRLNITLEIQVIPGDSVRLAYLRFPRQKSDLASYLQRLLRFRPGQLYRQSKVDRYRQLLEKQEFITSVKEPVLMLDEKGRYFLQIDFEEAPSTTLDGVIGYIPPPANSLEESGYFTGLLNIGVRNVLGGGRKLQIYWQKPDSLSDEFRIAYREPFIFGLPFNVQTEMYRLVRDVTFIEWQYGLEVDMPLGEAVSAFAGLSTRTVVPNAQTNLTLGLPRTESLVTETGLRWDARNRRRNPSKGVELEVAFSLSKQDNSGPDSIFAARDIRRSETVQQMRGNLDIFLPVFRRQVWANLFHGQLLENRGGQLRQPDQVWFGGATSVRGFREAQFVGRQVFWLNSEYRFLLGPEARFFLFADNAYYASDLPQRVRRWLHSYGLGLRFPGPLGILQVDFGLEKGTPFREGKLHFRLINEF